MNTETQKLFSLPVIASLDGLAAVAGLSRSMIDDLIWRTHSHYSKFTIPKRNGGTREITAPSYTLKGVQAWILRNVLERLAPSEIAMAFRPNISLIENVSAHKQNRYFLKIDIENFFPSISEERVKGVFRLLGYNDKVVKALSGLCCCEGRLPQGGVCSPHLSNIIVHRLDRRLIGLAARNNFAVTRYADDIVFSSNNPKRLRSRIQVVERIIREEGFVVNKKKLSFSGPDSRCLITGLIKDSSRPHFSIAREQYKLMRSVIYRFAKGMPITGKYTTKAQLMGYMSFLKSVDVSKYDVLLRYAKSLGIDLGSA